MKCKKYFVKIKSNKLTYGVPTYKPFPFLIHQNITLAYKQLEVLHPLARDVGSFYSQRVGVQPQNVHQKVALVKSPPLTTCIKKSNFSKCDVDLFSVLII